MQFTLYRTTRDGFQTWRAPTPRAYVCEGKRFPSIESATAHAAAIHAKSGAFVAIEAAPNGRRRFVTIEGRQTTGAIWYATNWTGYIRPFASFDAARHWLAGHTRRDEG